jgi:PPOX class probable F420-dependent enzyme
VSKPEIFNTWSKNDIDLFLSRHRVGSMGTIDQDGFPHVLPMWYTYIEGFIYISFRIPKKKYANLRKNPKMSFTVDAGEEFSSYHGVMIQGNAEFVDDPEFLERYYLAWTYRHFGSDADPYCKQITGAPRCVIRLVPEHIVTWDHRLMAAP